MLRGDVGSAELADDVTEGCLRTPKGVFFLCSQPPSGTLPASGVFRFLATSFHDQESSPPSGGHASTPTCGDSV